ncbi:hypothetical protein FHT86_001071 [Rhizobium sp. BK313]|uniref:hypothetical protein n=1 Tax=Rhizobium sp. BK313 TaxID=2587081 RepID=UPI00180C1E24|nr:hypothetical protein [Rhizobium sp. BK313]MBB3452815.1 hypothetical protein [Rhizobium sp. BK313]
MFNLLRAREIQRTAQHTLDDIATRFPAHLIDDVNARGLPPDRMLSVWAEDIADSGKEFFPIR